MWGQGNSVYQCREELGIIPTRVGTRKHILTLVNGNKDHPHACGDKWLERFGKSMDWGSSPRVWGQALPSPYYTNKARIIPTRVGTSAGSCYGKDLREDHPHACGDKSGTPLHNHRSLGSSPRVWGQVIVCFFHSLRNGIIPTRVGTSESEKRDTAQKWDHPHACGDK